MGNFKVKYASQLNIDRNWAYAPGHYFRFDWDKLQTDYPDPDCYLVALDEKQLNLIHHLLSVFPKYKRNWAGNDQIIEDAQWDEIQSWVSELEGCLMSGCKVSDLYASIDRLTAVVAGETITVGEQEFDYTSTGLIPTLKDLFSTSEELFYDSRNVAEILSVGLIGRKLNLLPLPWEGTGLADITDDMLDKLQDRFVQADYTGLSSEKNITETMEALLREDKFFDYEFFTPNIVTALRQLFTVGRKPGETYEEGTIDKIKVTLGKVIDWTRLPVFMKAFLKERVDVKEHLDTGDLLLMIADILKQVQSSTASIDASTIINLLNNVECAPGTNGANGDGPIAKIQITDEGVSVEGEAPLLGD